MACLGTCRPLLGPCLCLDRIDKGVQGWRLPNHSSLLLLQRVGHSAVKLFFC